MTGFTLIEIIIAMSLALSLAAVGVLTFNRVKRSETLFSVVAQTVQVLGAARVKSLASEKDRAWKVVIDPSRVSLQDETGVIAEEYQLPTAYQLAGPVNEVIFSRIDGRVAVCPNSCLFQINEAGGSLSHQFNILASGAIEY